MTAGWSELRAKVFPVVSQYVLIPAILVLSGVVINDRLKDSFVGPKTYKIFLVGNLADQETLRVYRGVEMESRLSGLSFDGISIELERRDDFANESIARSVSQDLAERSDTLLVLGHVLSTQTRAALPQYFGVDPPVPVVTTVDTLPTIWTPKSDQGRSFAPIFRMSPTDDKQAEAVADFALAHHKKRFVVVQDNWNPAYSNYLINRFTTQLRAHGINPEDIIPFTNQDPPSNETLMRIHPDCIFIAGEWSRSLIWAHLVRSVWSGSNEKNRPMIVLSDSAVNPQLLRPGDNDLNSVFLSFQLAACAYSQGDVNIYGTDAWQIVRRLVEQGNAAVAAGKLSAAGRIRRAFGIHRVVDARRILRDVMEADEAQSVPFTGSRGDTYLFDSEGLNTFGKFHIWEVQRNGFVDVDGPGDHCPPSSAPVPSSLAASFK
jgi:hypothetical protein